MSRTLRDYRMFGRFDEASVTVDYMDLDADGEEIWDGAGLISRGMLERLMISPHLSDEHKSDCAMNSSTSSAWNTRWSIARGNTRRMASSWMAWMWIFVCPRTSNTMQRPVDGTAFVGVNAVHSKDDMRLDMQSIMNLHPFINTEQMLGYLHQEGEILRDAIESGRKAEAMARLERATQEDLQAWPLRDFFARGGDANWFPGMVKSLINGHVQTHGIELERGKLRVPFPGGRYYVMTEAVAHQAGRTCAD
jgi:hypothetical protein